MARSLHQVGAAIPAGAAGGIRPELASAEVQCAPSRQQQPLVIGKPQGMRLVRLRHRRHSPKPREQRVRVGPGHFGIGRVGKRGIQKTAVARLAVVERAPEIVGAPGADAGRLVRGDVGRHQVAEWRRYHPSTGVGRTPSRGVAGHAIGCPGQVGPFDDLRSRVRHRDGPDIAAGFMQYLKRKHGQRQGDHRGEHREKDTFHLWIAPADCATGGAFGCAAWYG